MKRFYLIVSAVLLLAADSGSAAELSLERLRAAATTHDPRFRQLELERSTTELRIEDLHSRQRTSLDLTSRATYQTDVTEIPIGASPAGPSVPTPPKEQFEIALEAERILYDWGRLDQRERVEASGLAERLAEIEAILESVRAEVDRSFFGAAGLEQQVRIVDQAVADLEARRELVAARARHGAALQADVAAIEAELIRLRQDRLKLEGERLAALANLESLTGLDVDAGDTLVIPAAGEMGEARFLSRPAGSFGMTERGTRTDGSPGMTAAGNRPDSVAEGAAGPEDLLASRPEVRRLALARDRLLREAENAKLEDKPRASAFGRAAYGQPGLDFLNDSPDFYGLAGVRFSWPVLNGDRPSRQAQILRLQADGLDLQRQAVVESLLREVSRLVYEIARLEETLELDARAVSMREEIERVARRQLEEGVLLPADYVDRRHHLLEANLRHSLHLVELSRAEVALATLMGGDATVTATRQLIEIARPSLKVPPEER